MSQLFVLAGPSGVGKGTVVKLLREQHPELVVSISATTRSPRPGEVDGKDYIFLDRSQFEDQIQAGGFLEWAEVHRKNLYGTPKAPVVHALNGGSTVLVEIDMAGARQIRSCGLAATYIFLAPPSWDELVQRLEGRGTESAQERERRLETARAEMACQSEFDFVVVNNTVAKAASQIASLMGLD